MSTICYTWDDAPFPWDDTPFTWAEGCVIEKIATVGGLSPYRKERLRKDLTEEEKKVLINLFVRMNLDELLIEKRISKEKNRKIKIKIKDIEVLMKEQRMINVNVNEIEQINEDKKIKLKVKIL